MPTLSTERQAALSALVCGWLRDRLKDKLEKLSPDDPKRAALQQRFEPATWLAGAASRASRLQVITHSLKGVHSQAKGSSLLVSLETLPSLTVVGSHCLGNDYEQDVDGDAAALDVYAFLKLELEGVSLLALSRMRDPDWAAVLNSDLDIAKTYMAAFSLDKPCDSFSSHTLAKQVYWLIGDDPSDNAAFHLLALLYPTSLIHRFYGQLQQDRFGDAAKAAWTARKSRQYFEQPLHEYPNLAMRKLGGTKPLNVSQLNSERRGENLLLASLPPTWRSESVRPLLRTEDMFKVFGSRRQVRELAKALREFLETKPPATEATRNRCDAYVDALVDEFIQFTAEQRSLAEGWSRDGDCLLDEVAKRWLDPLGVPRSGEDDGPDAENVTERITEGFAKWLNERLRGELNVGSAEFREWRRRVREEVKAYAWEVDLEY